MYRYELVKEDRELQNQYLQATNPRQHSQTVTLSIFRAVPKLMCDMHGRNQQRVNQCLIQESLTREFDTWAYA